MTTTQGVPVYYPHRKKRKRASQEARTQMPKDAKQLIDERVSEMSPEMGEMEYKYVCMDTGMYFETYDEPAAFSPFTGTPNIESADDGAVEPEFDYYENGYYEAEQQMQNKGLPAGQADQKKQKPLKPNPAPSGGDPLGKQKQLKPNPAPSKGAPMGSTKAGSKGFTA